jgi:hypothetical protein
MEPEGSLLYSQVPTTSPYPEPTPSSPHNSLRSVSQLCVNTLPATKITLITDGIQFSSLRINKKPRN